jgi:hypothetical protein
VIVAKLKTIKNIKKRKGFISGERWRAETGRRTEFCLQLWPNATVTTNPRIREMRGTG